MRLRTAIVLSIGLSLRVIAAAANQCPVLSDHDQVRLISYVASKYNVPSTVKLAIKTAEPISEDCYRKLVFAGQGPLGEFTLVLFSSPDGRFLSQELMDSRLDPAQERYEKARKLMTQLTSGEAPVSGETNAPVTPVIFSDFECPYCKRAADIIRSESLVIEGKKVKVIYRYFPLAQHPWAQKAAETASCAAFQGSDLFWQVHDAIFRHQSDIRSDDAGAQIKDLALEVQGVSQSKLTECIEKQLSLGVVMRDKQMGEQLGVTATPTVFINGEVAQFDSALELHRILLKRLSDAVALTNSPNPAAAAQ